ncbi:MAG TPA: 23S rRNA (pseudouridine(1915)-N(3))-methyltransferase RlmH [Chlamydiales bacterium]|nr:23S rRNA (pseudouridine(1915)-N(3))-methyltransferase RlmH [Chlamydiales bacterium]
MFKVKVLTIGRSKESWLAEALAEYEKRLQGKLQLEWHFAKNNPQLITWARQEPSLIALDPKGELLTSEQFSQKIVKNSRLHFLIGGAEGIPAEIPTPIKWSLSPLTFTHQMTRLILLEQLYRALEIEKGSAYHK